MRRFLNGGGRLYLSSRLTDHDTGVVAIISKPQPYQHIFQSPATPRLQSTSIRIADGLGSANPHLTNLRSAHTSPASASSPNSLNLASANPCYSNIESWQLLLSSTQVRLAFVSSSVILYLLTSPYPSGCRLGLPYVRRCPTYGNHRATAPPSSSFSIRLDRSAALHVPRLPVVDFEGAYAPLRPSAVT